MEAVNRTIRQRQWPIFLGLAAVFGLPLFMAWAMYHYQPFEHRGGLEHGELITPVQRLQVSDLHDLDGVPVDGSLFRGKWTLLYHVPPRSADEGSQAGQCTAACLDLMDTLRRVRLAQGKSMRHVQRVLVESTAPAVDVDSAERFDKGLQVVTANNWPLPAGSVYVVDPQGYLVLQYRPGFDAKGLLKDLQRLLRLAGEE